MVNAQPSDTAFEDELKAYRSGLWRLLGRIIIYYICLGGALGLLALLFPIVRDFIPVGGISQYTQSPGGMNALIDRARYSPPPADWLATSIELFLAMVSSLLLMLPVSWLYTTIHEGPFSIPSPSPSAWPVLLPAYGSGAP